MSWGTHGNDEGNESFCSSIENSGRLTSTGVILGGLWEWLWHFKTFHDASALFCIICGHIRTATSGLKRHMDRYNRMEFGAPFAYPACEREGIPAASSVSKCVTSSPGLTTATSEFSDFPVSESLYELGDESKRTLELVDPALRDSQDLTHLIEDIQEAETDLSLPFEDP
ncbi:hypothetical protein GGS24DRAFT_496578 [Hypoxylon argillaceum]|nr:hypothetical protein GGS24DRAFT_496578 [Hypoxylon argillaceum]